MIDLRAQTKQACSPVILKPITDSKNIPYDFKMTSHVQLRHV